MCLEVVKNMRYTGEYCLPIDEVIQDASLLEYTRMLLVQEEPIIVSSKGNVNNLQFLFYFIYFIFKCSKYRTLYSQID